jgi:hypothetical protein
MFENCPLSSNHSLLIDCVINQHLQPEIPVYVEDWIHELLNKCWQFNCIVDDCMWIVYFEPI